MKRILGISLLLLWAMTGYSQSTQLTVNFKFAGIEEGYDHECKTQVLIDGEEVGESEVVKQSEGATFTVQVAPGQHELSVVNWALYDGVWEPHTVENNYSIDCTYTATHRFKKPEKLYLVFDLDNGTMASWKKPVKKK